FVEIDRSVDNSRCERMNRLRAVSEAAFALEAIGGEPNDVLRLGKRTASTAFLDEQLDHAHRLTPHGVGRGDDLDYVFEERTAAEQSPESGAFDPGVIGR